MFVRVAALATTKKTENNYPGVLMWGAVATLDTHYSIYACCPRYELCALARKCDLEAGPYIDRHGGGLHLIVK